MGTAEYRLYRNWTLVVMLWVMPVMLSAVGAPLLYFAVLHPSTGGPPPIFVLFWFALVAWVWFKTLRWPRRIVIHDDGRIEFINALGTVAIALQDIVAIRPDPGQLGVLTLVHASGKLQLLNQFDGFHEFLSRLKKANPSVELRGC